MKKIMKILGALLLLIVVAIGALTVYVKINFPAERIKEIVTPIISEATGRDVEIKDASVSVFPTLGFSIDGISIKNTKRTLVVSSDTTLSSYLDKFRLDAAYSIVEINDSLASDYVENDIKLKKGDKLVISRKDFSSTEDLFSMGNITINVKFLPLLQKKVEVSKILFDKISILVEVDKRGSFNFDDMIPPADTTKKKEVVETEEAVPLDSLPIEFRLESFEIRDAKIIYRNLKDDQEIVLGDIDQNVNFSIDKGLENVLTKGLLEVKNIAVSGKGIPVRKSNMNLMFKHDIAVQLKNGALTINDMQAGFQKNIISVKGSVIDFDKDIIDLDLAIKTNEIQLKELFAEIPPALSPEIKKISTAGSMQLAIDVKGKIDQNDSKKQPNINGSFMLKDIMFKYSDLPKAINELNGDIKFTENSLNISKFDFKIGENPIKFKAIIDNFLAPTVDIALNADLDLGIVKDVVPLENGVSVSGHIKTDVTAKGKVDPEDPTKIAVDGGVYFNKIRVTTPEVKKPIDMNGEFLFSNSALNLKEFTTVIGASSVTTDMKITNYLALVLPEKAKGATVMTYSMISPNFDVNEILGIDVEQMKKDNAKSENKTVAEKKADNSTGDEPIIIPELPNIIFDGKIRFKKIDVLTMPIRNAKVDLNYEERKVDFSMGATLFTGIITEVMHLDFTSKTIKFNNVFNSQKMEGNDFISAFNDVLEDDGSIMTQIKDLDNTLYGKMDLKTELSSAGYTQNQLKKNLVGEIYLDLYKGVIKSEKVLGNMKDGVPAIVAKFIPDLKDVKAEKFEIDLSIKNETIIVEKLETKTKKGDISMTGTSTFDGVLNLDTDVRFDKKVSAKILKNQNLAKDKASGAANKVIKNDMLKKVVSEGLNQVELVPSDKEGRVTTVMNISGPSDNLKYTFKGFKGTVQDGEEDKSIQDDLKAKAAAELAKQKAKLKAEADKARKQAYAKANAEKAKAQAKLNSEKAKAKKKADAEKAKAKAKADAEKKKAADKAKNEANKLKKGFGF